MDKELIRRRFMRGRGTYDSLIKKFFTEYEESPKKATDNYYEFSQNSNYIRVDRIAKNMHWFSDTEYGNLEITINLSKPEKDLRDIAKAKLAPQSSYPKCLLCKENEGYQGRIIESWSQGPDALGS